MFTLITPFPKIRSFFLSTLLLTIGAFTFLASSVVVAQEHFDAPELPNGYETWPTVVDETCDDLNIKFHIGATPFAEIEVVTFTWAEQLIATSIFEQGDANEDFRAYGLYEEVWYQLDTEASVEQVQRLLASAHLNAGQEPAVTAFAECMERIVPSFADIIDELRENMEAFGDSFNN